MNSHEALRVLDALDAAGIRSGITGGWGVDALLRRQTREHHDLDLGVPSSEIERAISALAPLGYAVKGDERPARLTLRSRTGLVDLHPIVWSKAGHGTQTALDGRTFEYPPGSLDAAGAIGGRPVRCGTAELQVAFHRGYEPTDRDRRDMSALAEAFGLALPAPY